MPEYIAVTCCECQRFQVQQVKKKPAFSCPVCNTNQSVRKVYSRAAQAKPIREAVAQLNAQQAAQQAQKEAADADPYSESCSRENSDSCEDSDPNCYGDYDSDELGAAYCDEHDAAVAAQQVAQPLDAEEASLWEGFVDKPAAAAKLSAQGANTLPATFVTELPAAKRSKGAQAGSSSSSSSRAGKLQPKARQAAPQAHERAIHQPIGNTAAAGMPVKRSRGALGDAVIGAKPHMKAGVSATAKAQPSVHQPWNRHAGASTATALDQPPAAFAAAQAQQRNINGAAAGSNAAAPADGQEAAAVADAGGWGSFVDPPEQVSALQGAGLLAQGFLTSL